MAEIAVSVAAKVAEYMVGPIARPFSYIWNYKTNFDNLKTEERKLQDRTQTVPHSIDEARRNGEQIEQHVNDWMDRVKTMTDEVSEVIKENEGANMKCFKGLCPNPKKRYQHSRNAVKKAKAVARLYEAGNFQAVSFRTIPEETWIRSYKGYMVFESRMSTLKNILDALSNPDVSMVGIYGAGGIGKTTLAREIAGQAEDKKLFQVVAFVAVAVKPDIKGIQQEIADKLGLTFREESASGRARRLQERLKQEEKILLVFDNIWERLNLEDVGIPFGNDHKGCKLLLTARSLDVLSNKMDSQSNFKVDFLDKREAWSLFEKKAGACDRLQGLAKNVAKACGGLPIAITSVAVALKAKEEFEWKDALRKLISPSTSNFEGVAAETYSSIEVSYNQLKEEELKSTFLLCCIMDYTLLEDLLSYGMGLGIFQNVEAIEDARNRVNTLVRKLKDSSLLLDIYNYRFSVHDVIRDVGRSIASRDGHMFTVTNNCVPRELTDKGILKNCTGISLRNITELPKEFECPELKFFYIRTTAEDYIRVPDNFFAGMPKLKVLHLARLELNSAPNSICLLVNLRTLCIDDCKLRDADFIGEFKQLEILRISSSYSFEIEMIIPKKMCNLTGLRLLDLKDCNGLRNIPPNVLSTFTQLEELYFPFEHFGRFKIQWEVEGVNILDVLKHLKHLTALKISIPDDSVLPKGRLLPNKLERYNIIIGNCSSWYRLHEQTSRMVQLNLETSSCSDDVQKFFSLLDREGFPELEHLHVENSPCFRTVVDCLESESCHHFLFLQSLSLDSVLNLEMIHNYPLKTDSFRQLRTIAVAKCSKLRNILSFSTYRALPLLQKVDVFGCCSMEEIFAIRREEDINNIKGTDQIEFKLLSSLTLKYLPKLTSFCSFNNNKDMFDTSTQLFNQKVAFPSLEVIKISKLDDLKTIWPNRLCNDSFCNLNSLEVKECNKLLTIFQSNMLERITRLESLSIYDCELVEKIFDLQGIDHEESHPAKETLLRELNLYGLPKLKHIWNKDPQKMFTYKKLSSVNVYDCTSLRYLFPVSIAESLFELKQLCVCHCGVEEIVSGDQGEVAATFVIPRIASLELKYLSRLKTFYRGVHSSQWQNLKSLVMHGCDKVELLASELFNFQENNEGQHCSSVQPLFIVEKDSFPVLEKLILSGEGARMISLSSEEFFCNLKFLQVYNDKSVVLFPLRILKRFRHLHELHLRYSSYKEIFLYEENETHVGVDSKLEMVLSKLERLTVGDCQNLIQLVPSSTSFQNLTVLKVWNCDGLKNLMTSSTAKRLVQLREMAIGSCKSMIEVVAKGGDVTEDKIIFSRLRTLGLGALPSLSCFCSENYTFELPSLEEIIVYACPEMKHFSLGDITTPILQKVRRGSKNYTIEGGLNTTIQMTHNSRYMYSWRNTARQLSLLKCLLTSPLQLLAFRLLLNILISYHSICYTLSLGLCNLCFSLSLLHINRVDDSWDWEMKHYFGNLDAEI
ncbi:hypothetical protein Ddye_028435 [Dipteronia dyeriana]|uniref:AAA+ ATPase domain-containing protein n=1 Tax=Dipteronia dyeriana TaxID=168575 RepID=A0AAD9TR04_9ROSI|nr:hypothetical protein Ddye_032595 [Dipteronia dyeriana]KAK2640640.1 hypothetical protein Ddye_028435 [Dipteronia dyeriana]